MNLQNMITVVGAHAEGEVGRVITGGLLPPAGDTMFDRMTNMQRDMDWVRQVLLFDPRGSVNTAINYVCPPCHPDADFGMIVIESDFYVPMSGSNLICTVTVVLETGMVPIIEPVTKLTVDTPAGLVYVTAECRDGKCKKVIFENVPSFVIHRDRIIEVPGFGSKRVDVAYGGMIYAIVDAQDFGFGITPDEGRQLVEVGEAIKQAAVDQLPSVHPENPKIHTVNQTEFAGPVETVNGVKTSKNAVVVSPGRLDRCPCGTGSSARLALLHDRGEISVGEVFLHRSILGTEFQCKILCTTPMKHQIGVLSQVAGRAWLTGISHYGVDPTDPFPTGYRLSDTWFG